MQMDFHYYATYCAAYLAGYSHKESVDIAYSSQLVDLCNSGFLGKIGAPADAATTQLQTDILDIYPNASGLAEIMRIWTAFHFLPYDLYGVVERGSRRYKNLYRLICNPNGELAVQTVRLARGGSLQGAGIAMHVIADTWAHRYFAGVPSYAINNVNDEFYERVPCGDGFTERRVKFNNNPLAVDNPRSGEYVASLSQADENSLMNLGHDRAGRLPDYSFASYRYMPAWGNYATVIKNNQHDYYMALRQMVYALQYIVGDIPEFEKDCYDDDVVADYEADIKAILARRETDSCAAWKSFAESLSEQEVPDFDIFRYQEEYKDAADAEKQDTFLGRFISAALAQKNMVAAAVAKSRKDGGN